MKQQVGDACQRRSSTASNDRNKRSRKRETARKKQVKAKRKALEAIQKEEGRSLVNGCCTARWIRASTNRGWNSWPLSKSSVRHRQYVYIAIMPRQNALGATMRVMRQRRTTECSHKVSIVKIRDLRCGVLLFFHTEQSCGGATRKPVELTSYQVRW